MRSAVAARCGTHHRAFTLTPNLISCCPRSSGTPTSRSRSPRRFALYHLAALARQSRQGGGERGRRRRDLRGPCLAARRLSRLPLTAHAMVRRVVGTLARRPSLRRFIPRGVWDRLRRMCSKDERYCNLSLAFQDSAARRASGAGLATHRCRWPGTTMLCNAISTRRREPTARTQALC